MNKNIKKSFKALFHQSDIKTYHIRDTTTECWLDETGGISSYDEGSFGNQEGMIAWCWLAEHGFSSSDGFGNGISETHRLWVCIA